MRWQAEHTVLVESLTNELEQKGCTVWIEHQNSFKIESPRSGLTVSGRPDLIARHPDGTAVIYDAKTGRQSTSHILQVQIYMYLLPRTPGSPWRGTRFSGAVVYADGTEHHIPLGEHRRPLRRTTRGVHAEDGVRDARTPRAQRVRVRPVRPHKRRLPRQDRAGHRPHHRRNRVTP